VRFCFAGLKYHDIRKDKIYLCRKGEKAAVIEQWIREIKQSCSPEELGMILVHNGVVRGTSQEGKPVRRMKTTYDAARLDAVVDLLRQREGIAAIKVWLNEGVLEVGEDIMKVCVAGRFRSDVFPVFQELLRVIKTEVIQEEELPF